MKTDDQPADVRVVAVEAIPVACLEHRGDPALIGDSVRRFIAWRKQAGLSPKISATFNILYNNPDTSPPGDYRLAICATTNREVPPNDAGIVPATIPGGRCAVLRHVGNDDNFAQALHYLCAVWLPQSGEERRDFPPYCQRVAFFPEVPEHEAITDVFLPLK